ncbi:MAG: Mur ligase, partial [Gammaproteobacteria bacterium]|nr:Mur ligase [Gammaproteobacteria bacterium]
ERLVARAAGEANPRSRALLDAAHGRRLPCLLDDEFLTIGAGPGGRTWPLSDLPNVEDVPWAELRAIPVALVTGTNGKTTVVRLITACAEAEGWTTGHSCTDGLYVDGVPIKTGDYSGPDGARALLRDARVEAAILETARGGILRCGLALGRADAAVITNISADHFGEYGIQDLGTLADVKLAVAHLIGRDGLLVLNADDEVLRAKSTQVDSPLGWFALNYEHKVLLMHRADGGATCGVRDGRLLLSHRDAEYDLGAVVSMPLTVDGVAAYNIANLAAAALGAVALGVAPAIIAAVFADFGSRPEDNVGRLMRYDIGGVRMLVDYAHNPAGVRGLLGVAEHLRSHGRIAVLLGQAGNREDADLRDLAAALAAFGPDLVVIKEELDYLRGRAPGEVPAILQAALLQAGLPESAIAFGTSDGDAARQAIAWSRPGDVLALLMHARKARTELLALFERMQQTGWQAGQPLPT